MDQGCSLRGGSVTLDCGRRIFPCSPAESPPEASACAASADAQSLGGVRDAEPQLVIPASATDPFGTAVSEAASFGPGPIATEPVATELSVTDPCATDPSPAGEGKSDEPRLVIESSHAPPTTGVSSGGAPRAFPRLVTEYSLVPPPTGASPGGVPHAFSRLVTTSLLARPTTEVPSGGATDAFSRLVTTSSLVPPTVEVFSGGVFRALPRLVKPTGLTSFPLATRVGPAPRGHRRTLASFAAVDRSAPSARDIGVLSGHLSHVSRYGLCRA